MPDNRRNFFSLFGGGRDDDHENTDTNNDVVDDNKSVEEAENDFLNGVSSDSFSSDDDNYSYENDSDEETDNASGFDLNSFLNGSSNEHTFENEEPVENESSEPEEAFEVDEPDETDNSEAVPAGEDENLLDDSETPKEVPNSDETAEEPNNISGENNDSASMLEKENDTSDSSNEDSIPDSNNFEKKADTVNDRKPVEKVSVDSYIPKLIKISDIDQSDENNYNRTMNDVDIGILAKAIKYAGRLFDPLTVYEGDDSKYHLISGNKRLAAWIKLNNEDDTWNKPEIPCFVIDKPSDEVREGRLQMNANIGRKSDVDMQNEVRIAKDIWENKMSETERKEMVPDLKAAFIDIVKDNKKYQKDPQGYLRNSFRPAVMFAWINTGEAGSYASVRKTMRDIANDTYELDKAVEPDIMNWDTSKATKPKPTPEEKLKAAANKLSKDISAYYDDKPATDEVVALLDAIEAFVSV